MKNTSVTVFLYFLLSFNSYAHTISSESRILASCEGIYLYAAHLSHMQNNEGLTKNILYRASRVTTAMLFLNESGGKVKGETLEQLKNVRRAEKPLLDTDPNSVYLKAGDCDKTTPSIIAKARNMQKIWDGKNFDTWQQMMFNEMLTTMGIK
jgi:hypothetical protein